MASGSAMASGRELGHALRDLSLKGISLGLERVCRLGVVIASARVLGQASFGRLVFALTVTTLLALGTDLGLGMWTTRALARSRSEGEQVVRVGLGLRGIASLPYGFAVATVAILVAGGEARAAIVLLAVSALLNAFVDHFGAILRGYERFADEARLNISRALLTAAVGLGALLLCRSLDGVCAGLAAASMGSCAYGCIIVARMHPLRTRPNRMARAWPEVSQPAIKELAKAALLESLPLWLAGLVSVLYFKVDTLFLRSMAGDSELGAYGAAYKFFEGSMMVPAVLLAVTFPQLSRAHNDPSAQRRLERQLGVVLLGLGLFAGAVCLGGAATLVRVVFGADFGRAVASLHVLAFGLPLVFVNYGLTHFLVARNMGRVTLWFALMMLGITVALDLALIPRMLGPGAAWATVLAEIALTACCLAALRTTAVSARAVSVPTSPSFAPPQTSRSS